MNRIYLLVLLSLVHTHKTETLNYQCAFCPTGKYKSATSNNQCISCPANTYQDRQAATSVTQCKPCPSNSYAPEGSVRTTDCLCVVGYTGDVATFLTGTQNDNLQRSCGVLLSSPCTTKQSKDQVTSDNAVDVSTSTQSFAVEMSKLQSFSIRVGNLEQFSLMEQNSLCASNLQWPGVATSMLVTCTYAVRRQYLYNSGVQQLRERHCVTVDRGDLVDGLRKLSREYVLGHGSRYLQPMPAFGRGQRVP